VFSWSVRQLSPAAARMFGLLGLHPGPDISAPAAASLAGHGHAQARSLLRELTSANLLTEHAPGRYALHDLLRAYASEQAESTESESERQAASGRILDHYLHTARTADLMFETARPPVTLAPARPGVTPEQPADSGQARAWFEAEHHVLLAAVALAAERGFGVHAWQLPWTMWGFHDRCGHWHQHAASQRTALAAATRLGDASKYTFRKAGQTRRPTRRVAAKVLTLHPAILQ
jgi:hypothetical protein